ncbi:Pfs, NACHT and Ankyrin domain protein [Beauveria brongniartii RCEF 3172]|uniref:Pfs, NACHT and Ankyrin domain protein n=1 Tax=Beauveria brongniartii RCEF 3172 TaxID=1081107 RepID=A0A167DW50_9HYPO|nr:Pfs, NACHT and Ankyrin domain protein [Beauveria brongniartii RCEF 3172]
MDQRPPLHGEQDSSLPLLPIERLPKASNGRSHARQDERRRAECTIAWICALDLEFTASRYMLDDEYKLPPIAGDHNLYVLGNIGKHRVVMTSLAGQIGTNRAAVVVTNLMRSFPGIYATFMVGIGGGVPSMDNDVHLGDVVVGTMVIQYDLGKVTTYEQFEPTATGKYPLWRLASAVSIFQSKQDAHRCGEEISSLLKSRLGDCPGRFARPERPDHLFRTSYDHPSNDTPPRPCVDCDLNRLSPRTPRALDLPSIFYGGIASGNKVIKNARTRDELSAKHKALCFEMEAAGVMVTSQCLVVRGISDYADSHKNNDWQEYAAAVAAAYTRLFLKDMQPEPGRKTTFELRLIAVPIVLTLLAKTAAALKRQNAILPQILSSADLNGQTFLVARRHDGQLWFTTKEGGSWTHRWTSTQQHAKSQPTCLIWGNPKRLGVFYIRDDRTVMTNSLLNGTWGDWETLGAKAGSTAVLCLEAQNAAVHVWIREDTRAKLIQHNYWENSRNDWHTVTPSWEPGINGVEAKGAHSAPAVACRNSTTTNDVIIYDKLGSPYHRQWLNNRNRWGPWNSLGGFYVGDPVLVSPADDRLDFFGVSKSSKSLVHTSWTIGSGYSDSRDLNGSWKSVPSVAMTASDRLDVFILSQSGTVHHRALLGSTWTSEWSDLNISATSAPLATRLDSSTPPQIMLQVVVAGGVVMNSEWEATSDGGLKKTVPMTQIGDGLSDDWLEVD